MSIQSLQGRRVLALGGAFEALATGPLEGARLESAGLERLIGVGPADADLVLIDADAWGAASLAAGIEALTLCAAPPPVLLIGAHMPTSVVRSLLRLERSDVLEAPYTVEHLTAAITTLMVRKAPAPPRLESRGPGRL
jgi:pilus assembly protein CpaE